MSDANGLLSIRDLDAYYDESHVLQAVSMNVAAGTVVALLGRNGAGKSTTLKAVMGIVRPRKGSVRLDGVELAGRPSHRIARCGLGYVPEERGVFPSLTIEENLTVAARSGSEGPQWRLDDVYGLFPRLKERRRNLGGQLSGGEQQMLSIGRALMLNPRMLLLDEPTEGLAPVVVAEIGEIMARLKDAGMTMLLVEQNYPFAARVADRVVVLGKGRVRWSGTVVGLAAEPEVRHTWLGI